MFSLFFLSLLHCFIKNKVLDETVHMQEGRNAVKCWEKEENGGRRVV